MTSNDKTKDVLQQILAQLYSDQAKQDKPSNDSYLVAGDGQFLGAIINDKYSSQSILNKYGPYGSKYSTTSIFNPYSNYGSRYGTHSVYNPYCAVPPKLIINGRSLGHVTVNRYVNDRISPEAFLNSLQNYLPALLGGKITDPGVVAGTTRTDAYIAAADGTFLGRLNPNRLDTDSIFNPFGPYGSKFSQTCIFNSFSSFGSQFAALSPYNRFTNTPPKIFSKGNFVAHLTVNPNLRPRIDPNEILEWAEKNISVNG